MHYGFSAFRIMAGLTTLVGGFDKIIAFGKVGFNPTQYGLVTWFVGLFHGENAYASDHMAIFFPKFLVYIAGSLIPFAEFFVGLFVVLGLFRLWASTAGIALMGIFLIAAEVAHLSPGMLTDIIQMYVWGIAFYLVYRQTHAGKPDPLALDNILAKRD